tara:strand:- start:2990 stop:3196 length:207 start_codon:yes stop_codon:yes gene_type:complete
MGRDNACQRQCQASCTAAVAQLLCVVVLVVASVYLATLVLEPLNLAGITTVPPGVLYAPYTIQTESSR